MTDTVAFSSGLQPTTLTIQEIRFRGFSLAGAYNEQPTHFALEVADADNTSVIYTSVSEVHGDNLQDAYAVSGLSVDGDYLIFPLIKTGLAIRGSALDSYWYAKMPFGRVQLAMSTPPSSDNLLIRGWALRYDTFNDVWYNQSRDLDAVSVLGCVS